MKLLALLVVSALAAGCVLDSGPEDDATSSVEQDVSGFITSPANYFYYQGGVYWYQDSYSRKWCTNPTSQIATWDSGTACNWVAWYDTTYRQYCSNGAFWQNKYYHYHCD